MSDPDPVERELEPPVGGAIAGTEAQLRRDRLLAKGTGSLRERTASGVMINAVFAVALQGLSFLRGFLVAIFLVPSDYGVWALLVIGYMALGILRQVGIGDKYIQQDDPDEEVAFQKAFTLEVILTGGFTVLLIILTPVLAIIYRAPEIVAPGLVSLLAVPGAILQTPIWAFAREMEFKRLRRLSAVDPVVGVVVTVAMAMGGFGYWSFVGGNIAGAWAGAFVIVRNSPYPLRFRYDRGTARQYVRFSRPILLARLSNSFLLQGTTLAARSAVGLAGIGAMSLASTIRQYTEFADGIISGTMYPAICAVKDRRDLLFESFVKSNRLALMWGVPVGVGVAVFADDLIHFILGGEWGFAVLLFQAMGITSAIAHIGFNWDSYVRALDDTRPIAKYAWIALASWGAVPIPLMLHSGLRGYSIGILAVAFVTLAARGYFLRKLFPGFGMLRHVARAVAPTVPAVVVVLLVRMLEPFPRSFFVALLELVLYLMVTALVTRLTERTLLREAIGYLQRARSGAVSFAT